MTEFSNPTPVNSRGEGFFSGPFALLWTHRKVLMETAILDMRSTYAGSALGTAWVIVAPLLLMGIYAIVYSFIFRVQLEDMSTAQYVMHVSMGLIGFLSFSAALGAGSVSVLTNKALLMNSVFPAELLPARSVIVVSVPSLTVGTIAVVIAALLIGKATWALLVIPIFIVLQLMFTIGIAWILSLLTLMLRDIQHLIQYIVVILLIITPIGYTLDMVPPKLGFLVHMNPVAYFVVTYQTLAVKGHLPPFEFLAGIVVMSCLMFWVGFWIFRRAKLAFYDYA